MELELNTPQIIYIALTFFGLIYIALNHGRPKGKYDVMSSSIATVVIYALLYWGGFFSG